MKLSAVRHILITFLLSLGAASLALAQGPLDHATRDQVARCTVRLDVSKAGGGAAQGSGTIVSPDGIIFTCAHVVEDAGETGEIQVLTFDEYNTEPVLQYFAQVILISDDLDFAILQIHQDRSRQSITTSQLNLPYLTSWNTSVEVGDDMVIFSYPQMGRQRLTMTAGIISAIQFQPFGGDRLEVYLSDAEFGEGGSGGVVVNSRGEFIGIPCEYSSGPDKAQLAVILPIETICEAQARACDYQPGLPIVTPPSNTDAPPILHIGGKARVYVEDEGLKLRFKAGTDYYIVENLPRGTIVTIIGGPTENQGYRWWNIRSPGGNEGWSVEAADGLSTLIPLPD